MAQKKDVGLPGEEGYTLGPYQCPTEFPIYEGGEGPWTMNGCVCALLAALLPHCNLRRSTSVLAPAIWPSDRPSLFSQGGLPPPAVHLCVRVNAQSTPGAKQVQATRALFTASVPTHTYRLSR